MQQPETTEVHAVRQNQGYRADPLCQHCGRRPKAHAVTSVTARTILHAGAHAHNDLVIVRQHHPVVEGVRVVGLVAAAVSTLATAVGAVVHTLVTDKHTA